MPGETWLVTHLEVGRDTVRAALAQLEEEGVLVSHGPGKRRQIVTNPKASVVKSIRLRIFLYEMESKGGIDNTNMLAQLLDAGMEASYTDKSLKDLGMNVERVARYVAKNPADAWVVCSASQEILEWFAGQPTPVIAKYGRHKGVPIAAAHTIMIPSLIAAVRRLIELGHKRIVMITREERRKPKLSLPEQVFLNELEAAGIKTGDYNLPDWTENRDGLAHCLEELFRHSPPTALIFQETPIFIAARAHLSDLGIATPRDVSLVVAGTDPSFVWSKPVPSHIHFDYRPVVRRIVRWARNVAYGKDDRLKSGVLAEFIEGGTIGRVPAMKNGPWMHTAGRNK